MRARRRTHKFPFGWLSAFTFHGLLFAAGVIVCLLAMEMRNAMGDEFEPTRDAVTATRENLGQMYAGLVPDNVDRRNYWASRVDQEIRNNDLASARGFLLAAPFMLDHRDASAVTAAATSGTTGGLDERLLTAAKLFLPDDVRARYERATAPVNYETPASDVPEEVNTEDADTTDIAVDQTVPEEEDLYASHTDDESLPSRSPHTDADETAFFVLGSPRDLAFQSAGWIRGDRINALSLRISGLGLVAREDLLDGFDADPRFFEGASLVKSAIRAGRLNDRFEDTLRSHLERALPEDRLKANLQMAFQQNSNLLIATDVVFGAFAKSIEVDRLNLIQADFQRIASLADKRSTIAAMTILETIESQRDLKRAELVSIAGGDRVIPLAKYTGSATLDAATTVMNWSMRLISLIALLAGVALLMAWLSVGTLLRSFHFSRRAPAPTTVPLY